MVTNAIQSVDFFRGGRAVFTVSNPKGERYTYSIRKPKGKDIYFAGLQNGGQPGSIYLGIFDPNAMAVKPTLKSAFPADSKVFKVLAWALRAVAAGTVPEEKGYAVQHEGRCCRCGKELTTPESIARGIGPECAKKGSF